MMNNNVVRRAAVSAVAASALAASLMTGGVANALPSGNYVAFGDSFAANPGKQGPSVPGRGGCPISVSNIGSHVAEQTGLELHDYSCNGTTAYVPNQPHKTINGQVDMAIQQGSLGPNTQLVTIYIGANDAMLTFPLPTNVQDELYRVNLTSALDKIKAASPTARVMLIGYPAFTSTDPVHYACPINANGFAPRIPAQLLNQFETALQNRQAQTADANGVGFVDMKPTANVDVAMCGADGQRLLSAFVDTDITSYNMTNHPTFLGAEVTGTVIANVYKSTF